jgi:hypothetical protein
VILRNAEEVLGTSLDVFDQLARSNQWADCGGQLCGTFEVVWKPRWDVDRALALYFLGLNVFAVPPSYQRQILTPTIGAGIDQVEDATIR